MARRTALLGSLLLTLGCAASSGERTPEASRPGHAPGVAADLQLTVPPYTQVHANWKQRLDQPYVYVELTGSYTRIGEALAEADRLVREQAIVPSGPPFALYYDDPGSVPADALRARACFPVDAVTAPTGRLQYDVLESTTVVYAFVSGPYPEVPRAYPGIYEYMRSLSWSENGPIRESYLVDPSLVTDWSQLVTEVQIPATAR